MNKHIIQTFIILIVILLGVSLVSEVNNKNVLVDNIKDFEEDVANREEVENGEIAEVNGVVIDSSNLISNVNAKIATIIIKSLNFILKAGIKIIDGMM